MREVSPELYNKSFKIACLEEIIKRLPNGDDTLLEEKGYTLSGGERQRVGIARAICKDAPILLLDEATSALDSNTEKRILDQLLSEYIKDKTIFIVAHRISTLSNSDNIIVFDKGQIIENGKYNELIKNEGTRFYSMYKLQSENK